MKGTLIIHYDSDSNDHVYHKRQEVHVQELKGFDACYAVYREGGLDWIPKNLVEIEDDTEPCPHKLITTAFVTGKSIKNGAKEKDFLVSCSDCDEELFRISAYGRQIASLIPIG